MVAADPASFRSGPLAGRFEVLQQFSGGEGTTALVREQRTGEQLVLKVLDPEVAPAEGALLSSLRHPAIPAVREVGRLGDGRAFLVRDYAPGRPLAELLPLPPERALDLARQVLAVLAFVHLRGVLHLDLKPQNLVVGDDGAVRLLDFGLGVRQGASSRGGTPFFAAPELLVGGTPDARSDLFSLGAVLVAALWPKPGKLPLARFLHQFPAQSFWIAADVEPAQFPAPFADFLPRCVARRPQRRFADAQAALEFLAGGTGRPALDLLRPDPITVFADALAAQVPGDDDVTLVGGAAADRQALALHFLCTLPGARSVAVTGESVRVVRLGGSSAPLRLPAISVPLLRPHLEQALGLQGAAATKAAELLLAGGERTAAAIGDRLVALAENGAVLPDGTRWLWPDAVAGRLGAVPDRAVAPTTASVLAAATAGQVELAFALWRRGAGDGDERALRTALVRGVLAAGDPARALPLCHDLPVERVQALFDLGQVAAATAALDGARAAAAATADGTRRLRRTEGQILTARGEHGPAIALLRALCAHDPRPEELQTLAAALETAGQAAESRELLQSLLPRFDAAAAPYLRAAVLTSMAHAERRLGAPERALADFQEARDLMFKVGHARHAATATHNLGVLAKDRGAMVEAVAHLRQARSLFQHVRDEGGAATAEANLGIVALETGDAVAAERRLRTAVLELQRLGNLSAAALAQVMHARALAQSGRHDEAAHTLVELGPPTSARLQAETERVRELLQRAADPVARTVDPPAAREPSDGAEEVPADQAVSRELFRTFLAVNRRLASESDLEKAMAYLLEAAVTLTGGRHGYLLVARADGLKREFQSGDQGPAGQAFSRSLANRAMQQRRTLTGEDALADRELQEMPSIRNLQVRSAVCAPFRAATGAQGAIYVEHPGRQGAFTQRDKDSLEVLADQAAIAVDRMLRDEQLSAELQRSRRDLAVAQRVARRAPTTLVGDSAVMRELRTQIEKLGQHDLAVVILGETGTGKELVARAIHAAGPRRKGPFVAENCSALPAELMERELFGHVEGAFTGADRDRPGLLELANGGTLMLDEVGDMPPALQAKLLRALQEKAIRRVGGSEMIALDLRLLAATHKDLRAMVAHGEFREDLFFRLAAIELRVPPLRERAGDVAVLARFFLDSNVKEHGVRRTLAAPALAALQAYRWPGNVRELEHVIARAFLLAEGEQIDDVHLPAVADVLSPAAALGTATANTPPAAGWPAIPLAEAEHRTILAALQACAGDKTKTAKLLQISRTALYEKLKRHQAAGTGDRGR